MAFLATPLGKFVGILVLVVFLFGAFLGAKKLYDNSIAQTALLEYNIRQTEQVIKENKEFDARTKRLEQLSIVINDQLAAQRDEWRKRFDDVNQYLETPEVKKNDSGADAILKETLKRMGAPK